MNKKTYFNAGFFSLVVFIFFFSVFVYVAFAAENELIFTENFTQSNFSVDFCDNMQTPDIDGQFWNMTKDNIITRDTKFTLDNLWYCLEQTTGGEDSILQNISGDVVNTNQGSQLFLNRAGTSCTSPSNCRWGMVHFFDEVRVWTTNSFIEFYCSDFDNANDNHYLYLRNDRADNGLSICLDNRTGGCDDLIGRTPNVCDVSDLYDCTNSTAHFSRITSNDLKNRCGDSFSRVENITSIEYRAVFPNDNDDDGILDDLKIRLFNGTNSLPSGKIITDDNLLCVENVNDIIQINITVNASDEENDTLYYGHSYNAGNDSVNIFFTEDQRCNPLDIFCQVEPDLDFVNNVVYPYPNMCRVSNNETFDVGTFNLITGLDQNDIPVYKLLLDQNCDDSDKRYIYHIQKPLDPFRYETYFYDVDNGDVFNITFFDSSFTEKLKLRFNVDNDIFLTHIYNSSMESLLIINESNGDMIDNDTFGLFVSTFGDGNNVTIHFILEDTTNVYEFVNQIDNNNLLEYVGIQINSTTTIIQQDFSYGGVLEEISFSTNKPQNFTGRIGSNTFTVFFSDEVNQPDKWSSKDISVSVLLCKEEKDYVLNETVKADLDTFGRVNERSCGILNNAFNKMTGAENNRINFCKIIAFSIALICLGFGILTALFIATIDSGFSMPVGLIVYSLSNSIFSFMTTYSATYKVFLGLVFAISVLMLIVRIFFTGGASAIADE